jgi:hypothetical protein
MYHTEQKLRELSKSLQKGQEENQLKFISTISNPNFAQDNGVEKPEENKQAYLFRKPNEIQYDNIEISKRENGDLDADQNDEVIQDDQ